MRSTQPAKIAVGELNAHPKASRNGSWFWISLNSFNSASAFSSHNPISISRIIVDAVGEMLLAACLPISCPPAQFAQTNVAMRDERAHAEFFSEGESLAIVVFRLADINGIFARRDLAKEPKSVRLVSSLFRADGRDAGRAVRRDGHPLPARPADTLRSARWSAATGPPGSRPRRGARRPPPGGELPQHCAQRAHRRSLEQNSLREREAGCPLPDRPPGRARVRELPGEDPPA